MIGHDADLGALTLLVGSVAIAVALVRAVLARLGLPALVGYIALGFAIGIAHRATALLDRDALALIEFLGQIGIICLLFHVGLGSQVGRLLRQIRPALVIGSIQVGLSFGLGFAASHWLLGLGTIPSLILGVALTATSVGVSVALWDEAGLLGTSDADLLLDVAELDDMSAVVAMSVLVALLVPLANGTQGSWVPLLARTALAAALKVAVFIALCLLFSRYVERRLTQITARARGDAPTLLLIAGTGLAAAAAADLLGLGVAVGAFFAGLAFSRDPVAVRADASFQALYELFVPFFFVWIGLRIDPETLLAGAGAGSVLLVAGVLGKYLGTAWPARRIAGATRWRELAVSMLPRAEIALLVVGAGHALGPWAVPDHALSAMVFVCAATTIGAPLVMQRWLRVDAAAQSASD